MVKLRNKNTEDVVTIQVNMPSAYADAVSWETQGFCSCVFSFSYRRLLGVVSVEGFFIGFMCIKLF